MAEIETLVGAAAGTPPATHRAPSRRVGPSRSSGLLGTQGAPTPTSAGALLSAAATPPRLPAAPPRPPGSYSLGLNAGSTPQAQALPPVRRKGSFLGLKRANSDADSGVSPSNSCSSLDQGANSGASGSTSTRGAPAPRTSASGGSSPSGGNLRPTAGPGGREVKKQTHWEAYGTVMVLFTACAGSPEANTARQMLCAEGYDVQVANSSEQTVGLFDTQLVYPDVVLVDSDQAEGECRKLIKQLFSLNPTVAILVIGGASSAAGSSAAGAAALTAVEALQGGAADFMRKPVDLDELVARVERHVQRQHCIKLELETALEEAQKMMDKMATSSHGMSLQQLQQQVAAGPPPPPPPPPADTPLGAVAETDFEVQMGDLSEENSTLRSRVQELQHELEQRPMALA